MCQRQEQDIQQNFQNPPALLMVWGMVYLHMWEGTTDEEVYVWILERYMLQLKWHDHRFYQEDNVRPHCVTYNNVVS